MNIGVNISLDGLNQTNKLTGYDFIEISDFIFPQFLCYPEFMDKLHEVLGSGQYPIRCLQGPIRDIKPEAADPEILAITKKRFIKLIEIAAQYQIPYILFSTTFDPLVRFDFYDGMWLENNKKFWEEIIPIAEKHNVICLYSNVWDENPSLLYQLFEHINSDYFKFGMDIGHLVYMTTVPMTEWFARLKAHIRYVLVHDNFGQRDDHLAIGDGNINFDEVLDEVTKLDQRPDLCIQLFDLSKLQVSIDRLRSLVDQRV